MDKWEYKTILNCTNEELNKMGKDGWELCGNPVAYSYYKGDCKFSYTFKKKQESPSSFQNTVLNILSQLLSAVKSLKSVQQPNKTSPTPSSTKDDFKLPLEAEKKRNKKEIRDLFLKALEQRSAEGR